MDTATLGSNYQTSNCSVFFPALLYYCHASDNSLRQLVLLSKVESCAYLLH